MYERNMDPLPPVCAPQGPTRNLGVSPDQESNQQPLVAPDDPLTNEEATPSRAEGDF